MTIQDARNLSVAQIESMTIDKIDNLFSELYSLKFQLEADNSNDVETIAHLDELIPAAKAQLRLLVAGW